MSRLVLVVIFFTSLLHAVLADLILNVPVSGCQVPDDIPCRTGACWQRTGTILPKAVVKGTFKFHQDSC